MLDLLFSDPRIFLLSAIALLVAITVHEFAHAFVADRLGDPTARLLGRLTLNPLAHLDPLGTILLLLIGFGWGKPVEFDQYNLKRPRQDAAVIALAGPFSNLLLASAASILWRVMDPSYSIFLYIFILRNVQLAVFNLIPVHPLDGGKILVGLLPKGSAHAVDLFLRRYGVWVLLITIFPLFGGFSLISAVISPLVNLLMSIYLPANQFI